jgi:hypothetical protein
VDTHSIAVRVVNSEGQTSGQDSASARTAAPKPPDPPSLKLTKGPSAVGQPTCGSIYCHYLVITPHNLGSGTYSYDCYQNGTKFAGSSGSFSDGNASQLYCYNGNPYEVYVVINGVKSNSVYPKPDWG